MIVDMFRFRECFVPNSEKIVRHPFENHPMDDCNFFYIDLFNLSLFTRYGISFFRKGKIKGFWRPGSLFLHKGGHYSKRGGEISA